MALIYPKDGRTKQIFTNGFENANGLLIDYGTGTPEGVVTAPIGSRYTDTSSGVTYEKISGSGNTGWRRPGSSMVWDNTKDYKTGDVVYSPVIGISKIMSSEFITQATPVQFICYNDYTGGTSSESIPNANNFKSLDSNIVTVFSLGILSLSVGSLVAIDPSQSMGGFKPAIANGTKNRAIGVLISKDVTGCHVMLRGFARLTTAEWDAVTGLTGGLVQGDYYYTSQLLDGLIDANKPTSGEIQVAIKGLTDEIAEVVCGNTSTSDETGSSYIRRSGGTTRASDGSFNMIFSNANGSGGTDITYSTSSVTGDTFTINTNGIYTIMVYSYANNPNSLLIYLDGMAVTGNTLQGHISSSFTGYCSAGQVFKTYFDYSVAPSEGIISIAKVA